MTSLPRYQPSDQESHLLAALKEHYLAQGFTFDIEPKGELVPSFLGSYRPDAIAKKTGSNVAIEVRQRRTPTTELTLKDIRRLFDGHPDWQFVVAYASEDPLKSLTIDASSVSDIRDRLAQVRMLQSQRQLRAAFILGWSLLEATLVRVESATGARPRTPGTVLQSLAMLGYIDSKVEQQLRSLINLRNRVVHGDLAAEPTAADVEVILSAVEEALAESET